MGNQKLTALILAGALAVGLCGAAVFAEESVYEDSSSSGQMMGEELIQAEPQPSQDIQATEENSAVDSQEEEESAQDIKKDETVFVQEGGESGHETLGAVSFAELKDRLRKGNLNLLALEETIASIEAIDYEELTDELRKQINAIASAQYELKAAQLPSTGNVVQDFVNGTLMEATTSATLQSLQQAYDSLRETFDDLKEGKLQEDNNAVIRQLRNAQDQIIMAAESLYTALVELEINCAALDRSEAALNRTVQEMELRYSMGQISSLTLQEVKAGRTSLESGKATLEMTVRNLRTQLELMLGVELTGSIQVKGLERVSTQDLGTMQLEEDLKVAKDKSYSLFAALRTLKDAEEAFETAKDDYGYKDYQYVSAEHTWKSAQYTYEATVQNFENSFRTLYHQVKDYQQILGAAETALAVEEASCAAAQLKYEQGTLAYNKLLDAQDELAAARDQVDTAAIDLFTAYNNYCWAVNFGILN